MSEHWYKDGLRFRCTRCGDCCSGQPGFVWVNDEELAALANYLGESVEEVRLLYMRPAHRGLTLREKIGGDCVFFSREEGCTVYPVRPRQCRTWPFWESNLETPEQWGHTCTVCPGSGQGQLISAEEITRRLQEIRL
jgi:uncharacterized protein